MAPSSYAEQYIEYLNKQGKFIATEGSEALKPETEIPVPSRSEVRKESRRERELMTVDPQLPQKLVTTPVLVRSAVILIIIGVLLISSVWMGAKATAIKYSMNSMTKENVQLRDEITVLGIDIEGAVRIDKETEIAKGVRIVPTPGHTAGSVSVFVDADRHYAIVGDAVPLRDNFTKRIAPKLNVDEAAAMDSIGRIADYADVIVPGHDQPFRAR